MKKSLTKKLIISLLYFATAIIIELITFAFLENISFPKYLTLELAIVLIFASLVFITPKKYGGAITATVLLAAQMVLSFLNMVLYETLGDFFTLNMLVDGREGMTAFSLDIINFPFCITLLLVAGISIFSMFYLSKRCELEKHIKRLPVAIAIIFCSLQILGVFTIVANNTISIASTKENLIFEESDYAYAEDPRSYKINAMSCFGTFGFYFYELSYTQHFVDQETTSAYFNNDNFSEKNDFSAVSEGNNVIVIMVESLAKFTYANKNLTPNLYSIFVEGNQSVVFDNYYSNNKTNISEMTGMLGSYPFKTPFSKNYRVSDKISDNKLSYSLPNVLKSYNDQLSTTYMHNYMGMFYGREVILPHVGYDTVFFGETMNIPQFSENWGEWLLDSIMFEEMKDEIAPSDKEFLTNVTTVSMHGNYMDNAWRKNNLQPYYAQIDEALKNGTYPEFPYDKTMMTPAYKTYFRNYIAAVMDLDKGIGILLDYLKNTEDEVHGGKLIDNTTLFIYGDHGPYFHTLNSAALHLSEEEKFSSETYNIPMAIYDTKLKAKFDEFAQEDGNTYSNITQRLARTIDITPTILDLLGISYNESIYMGKSLFEDCTGGNFTVDEQEVYVSYIAGYFNENIYSLSGETLLWQKEGSVVDMSAVQQYIREFDDMQEIFESMYHYNILNDKTDFVISQKFD